MKKTLLVLLIIFAAFGLVSAMFLGLAVLRGTRVSAADLPQERGWGWMPMMGWFSRGDTAQTNCPGIGSARGYGMMGRGGMMGGGMMGGGMMGGYRTGGSAGRYGSCPFTGGNQAPSDSGTRLSIDQALEKAQAYIADDDNLTVHEVMEFEDNFYAVVLEKDSGKGAMELLVDPYSGNVWPEYGPNMMWNQKYGHMGRWFGGKASLSLDEASQAAQEALNEQLPGAQVEGMGIEFYGYFTFDYTVDGQTAGMLSVSASSGDAWLHTWHGEFIDEIELEE